MNRRLALGAAAALLAAGLGASPAGAARADSTRAERAAAARAAEARAAESRVRQQQIETQLQSLKSAVHEASAQESGLLGRLDQARARRRELETRLLGLDGQLGTARTDLERAQGRLDQLEAGYLASKAKLDVAESQVGGARKLMTTRAVAAYTGRPALARYANLVLGAKDLREWSMGKGYADAVLNDTAHSLVRYRSLRDQVEQLKQDLSAKRDEALSVRDVVSSHEQRLESTRRAQEAARQAVLTQAREQDGLLTEVRSRKGEFERQIAALRRESASITALLRARQAGQALQGGGRGVLSSPLPGNAVVSGFGARLHPIYGDVRQHTGIDFEAASGTPVRAAAAGVVVTAAWRGGYGNAVILDHGDALATLYAHLSSVAVASGASVAKGQVIGYVGSTGFSTGPHLHFEVRVNGAPVNPLAYL